MQDHPIVKPPKPYYVRKSRVSWFGSEYQIFYEETAVMSSNNASIIYDVCDAMNTAYSVGWYDSIVPNTPYITDLTISQLKQKGIINETV